MATSFRQVLVHLDFTPTTHGRLAAARGIADAQEAALGALYAVTPAVVDLPYAPEMAPGISAELFAIDDDRRSRTLKAFDKAMAGSGTMAAWAETSEIPVAGAFVQQALFADLLVLGQYQPGEALSRAVPPDFIESVLMASGRPAVVIPYIGWAGLIGETVAIAWKETREAARAVAAAMPFLQRAERVHVLAWGEDRDAPRIGGHALNLEEYLDLHGVNATFHRETAAEPDALGEMLLSRACDLGADLLVMGCYGHSRAREWLLGGATRTILNAMTLPVLMAH